MQFSASLIAAGLVLTAGTAAHAAIAVNDGGFENWSTTSTLSQWVYVGGATSTQNTTNVTQGSSSASLNLPSGAYIYTGNFGQSLQADMTYTVSIDYNPTSTTGSEIYVLDVKLWLYNAGGSQINAWGPENWVILNATNTPGVFNTWNTLSFDFGADTARPLTDGTAYALVVVNTWDGTEFKGLVDNLQFTTVPEPTSLMALGALAPLALRRRRSL